LSDSAPPLIAGNTFDKYGSRNPVHRRLMRRFLADAAELVRRAAARRVLEVGCGSGELSAALFAAAPVEFHGVDLSPQQVEDARRMQPDRSFQVASAYELPFDRGAFDLVVACEVLEHLDHPEQALREIRRVCAGHVLVSVPWEPVWRLANLARGAYVRQLGNTPGHVQHFSRRRLRALVRSQFRLLEERRPFPWTMLLAEVPPS
jgi:2-polyprenyl-3-methyl-5-hydroxy-6-metoxy-1,4-benzoquinol methylase